jgi:hypothetical protein
MIWTASFLMAIPSMLTGLTAGIFSQSQTPVEYPNWYWALIGASTVVSSVLWIIPYTFLAFQFFNLDERTKTTEPTENQ